MRLLTRKNDRYYNEHRHTSGKSQPQTILLIDQQKHTADLLKSYLSTNGYRVDHTADPSSALKYASQEKYEMVITDLLMKDMTGFDVYREIKSFDDEIKFMFLVSTCGHSAYYYEYIRRLFGSLERQDIIKKEPLSINEVIYKVRAAFDSTAGMTRCN